MLEAKYYRDYRHNYMILQCSREEEARSYQYKMLTSDRIKEILKCSVRHINGVTYYYYDISSKTTLEALYRGKKMTYSQVKDVLCQLCAVCGKLSGCFMDAEKLVLQPEHIYYDMTNNKLIGLYYPDYHAAGTEIYRPLMDFLLEYADTEDERLTEKVYRIYEMAEEASFCLEDALRVLEDVDESAGETVQGVEMEAMREPLWKEALQEPSQKPSKEPFQQIEPDWEPEERLIEKKEKKPLFYPIFLALSTAGIAGALAVCNLYELTQEEQLAVYGVVAALVVCAAACLAGIYHGRRKGGAAKRERGRDRGFGDEPGEGFGEGLDAGEKNLGLEHVIDRDMLYYNEKQAVISYVGEKPTDMPQEADYGNTVFFDENSLTEYKLYATDKKNKRHIELKRFPYTIGKMAGCVDYVLADDSVSRIHARFDKQGDLVMLTDMNSTNGTYKNGLRMQPQETVEIEPGDEIRFGNLNYSYR